MLEKNEGQIKNGQSRDTGNDGHKTQNQYIQEIVNTMQITSHISLGRNKLRIIICIHIMHHE
jgi:hypothetical protein